VAYTAHAAVDLDRHAASKSWLTGVAADYPAGHEVDAHHHDRGQLLYALEGVMVVEATRGRWIVPPTTAVWLPPRVEHRLLMCGPVRVRSTLVAAAVARRLPRSECVVHVSALLRELIARAASLSVDVCATPHGQLVAKLLVEELRSQHPLPFHLPWPADEQMAAVCRTLAADASHPFSTEEWATALAMSAKTFQRHFKTATGMSFGRWRQQARLQGALDAILGGRPLLKVALECGYESHSAFTQAFRRHFGAPPSKFIDQGFRASLGIRSEHSRTGVVR